MRERFLRAGGESFADHELLEMFLYNSIPRRDTNEIAHALLDRFGSLRGVFEASAEELREIDMIGNSSVALVRLFSEIMRRYASQKDAGKEIKYDTVAKISEFFLNKYVGIGIETVYAMFLDNSYRLIDCKKIFEGSISSVSFEPRKIYEAAFAYRAMGVVIAHNHPRGIAIPSSDDINATVMMATGLDMLGIKLIEHMIVASGRCVPIMRFSENPTLKNAARDSLPVFRDTEE